MSDNRIYLFKWTDSSFTLGWINKDQEPPSTAICETIGWVVDRDKEAVVVASCQNEDQWGQITVIPLVSLFLQLELRVVEESVKSDDEQLKQLWLKKELEMTYPYGE